MNFYESDIQSANFWLSTDAIIHCKSIHQFYPVFLITGCKYGKRNLIYLLSVIFPESSLGNVILLSLETGINHALFPYAKYIRKMNNFFSLSQSQFLLLSFMPLTHSFAKIAYTSKKSLIPQVNIHTPTKYSQ